MKVKVVIQNQEGHLISFCITLTLARSQMSLPNSFDPETPSVNCMTLGKCRTKYW